MNEIRNNFSDKAWNDAVRAFAGSFISDRGIVKQKQKLFYNDADSVSESYFRVVDEGQFKKYKPKAFRKLRFEPEGGVIKEFFDNKPFTLELPVGEGKDITTSFIQHYLGPMAQNGLIDDLTYVVIKNVCSLIGVVYDREAGYVAFGPDKRTDKVKSGKMVTVKVKDITLDEVLNAEIELGYTNPLIGDPTRCMAYGHLLREYAKFKMFEWTKNAVLSMKKYNVWATSRGQGKTYFAAELASMELLNPTPGFGGRPYREIQYFVPNKEDVGGQVMKYMSSLLGKLAKEKFNGEPAFDIVQSKYYIKCNITGNVFKIVSLNKIGSDKTELGTGIGEGIACDVAIVDEACRIPDSFWTSFHQRAVFETQRFFLVSTINEETPRDHWFYKLLIAGETGDPEISSHRVTIEQNEMMKMNRTHEEYLKVLEQAKQTMREKGEKEFYSKGYCVILEESNVFNTGTYLVTPQESKFSDDDPRILGFDLGKLTDTCGLVVINLKHRIIEEARIVTNATYGTQLAYAEEYKKRFKNMLVIGDRSGVGEAVSEQDVKGVVDTWIKSTGQGGLSYNRQYKYYTCSKSTIISVMASVLNTNMLKIPSDSASLIEQMNNFTKMKSDRGDVILYKGKGKKHDDLVLSCAYAITYMYSILGLKSVQEMEAYVSQIGDSEIYAYSDVSDNANAGGYYNGMY